MSEATEAGRKLRIKERRTYTDEDIDDDEIEGKRTFDLDEKLESKKYNKDFVRVMKGDEFNLAYMQKNGLEQPIVIYDKTGLGMRVPSQNFRVSDVKQCVGSRRVLDVMDVNTQKGKEMTMREWVQYFENENRERLLNVISLEFSHTKLENYVESPTLVRQIDWVDTVWPQYLKECQTESTNIIEKMKYPKVQKYCLMSVAGCFTDFHIDFGGTSVWYHILHGEKVFWLIPPTEKNLDTYVNWVLSGKQGDVFLADHVEGCQRIELKEGFTFIIPSGWIHAVYTPKDSLVFGGNFLHSFNVNNQLRVSEVEDKTHVKQKFRYPFYAEIAWYVLAQYIKCVTGKQCLDVRPQEDKENEICAEYDDDSRPPSRCSQENDHVEIKRSDSKESVRSRPSTPKLDKSVMIELTRIDHSTHKKSVSDDESTLPLPGRRRRSPRKSSSDSCSSADTEIYEQADDAALLGMKADLDDKTDLKNENRTSARNNDKNDTSSIKSEKVWKYLTKWDLAGIKHLIKWLESLPSSKKGVPRDMLDPAAVLQDAKQLCIDHMNDSPEQAVTGDPILSWPPSKKKLKPKIKLPGGSGTKKSSGKGSPSSGVRRRRTRCKKCEPCTRSDCGECNFCKDMKKFGGPGRMKQSCTSRQCLAPVIPSAATCMICGADERVKDEDSEDMVTKLMECGICWEIVHPTCLAQKYENLDNNGVVNEDLPNSWECPKCCHDGKQGQLKPRIMKGQSIKSSKFGDTTSHTVNGSPMMDFKLDGEGEMEGKRVTVRQGAMHKNSSREKDENDDDDDDDIVDDDHDVDVEDDYKDEELVNKMDDDTTLEDNDDDNDIKVEKSEDNNEDHAISPHKPKTRDRDRHVASKKSTSLGSLRKKKTGVPMKTKLRSLSGKKLVHQTIKKKPMYKSTSNLPLKRKGDSTPDKLNGEDGPVVTRSGRTVKKSPQLTDENMSSDLPRKRPRREGHFDTSPTGIPKKVQGQKEKKTDITPVRKLRLNKKSETPLVVEENTEDLPVPSTSESNPLRKTLHTGNQQKGSRKRASNSQNNSSPSKKRPTPSKGSGGENLPNGKSNIQCSKGDGSTVHMQLMLKEPKIVLQRYVVRPIPITPPDDFVLLETGSKHVLNRELWMKIFRYLSIYDLGQCLIVSKTFHRWCMHHSLWQHLDFSNIRICQPHLMAIVKRQPYRLDLNSVTMYQRQLSWLLQRIPQLKELYLKACSWATVSALCLACPLLSLLDISWTSGLSQQGFHDIISPLTDRIPGMKDVSRLHQLKTLIIAGTEVTDASLSLIAEHLTVLEYLDLSYCSLITNDGIRMLVSTEGNVHESLKKLNLSGCKKLSEGIFEDLNSCKNLEQIIVKNCSGLSRSVLMRSVSSSKLKFDF